MSARARLYAEKPGGYFGATRLDLLEMLPRGGGLRILEVGAGAGATLREAKLRGLAAYTVGLDIMAPPATPADHAGADRVLVGDVETMPLELPEDFDAVLCADVLEHLVEPWTTVARLARLLKPGGVFLSSLPNFRNHRVLRPLLFQGDFRYAEAGLLDRSHLRFFCRKNIRQLFEQAGLVVEAMEENMGAYGLRHRFVDFSTLGLLHELFVFQYRTRARKPGGAAA
jgi:2-polyprenyl-3-methyl-5-hydroxy-6-metoxy-1,4-benzoquinol methylase